MKLKKACDKVIGMIVNTVTSSVSQTSVKNAKETYPPVAEIDVRCRNAAAESFVLLKNKNHTLPLNKEDVVSVFGRVQFDSFFVGYGSGGDVNAHYTISFSDGLHNAGIRTNATVEKCYQKWRKKNPVDNGYWGHWPMSYEEMPLTKELADEAAENSSAALYFIGRAAGEDRENTLTPGSFYLTPTEEANIALLREHFSRFAVIMNIGGIMDFSWIEKYNVPCVGICWQGGMEAGNGLADVLSGKQSPSGKLTDTIAASYQAYPSAYHFGNKKVNLYEEDIFVGYRYFETFAKNDVLFPFGWGLSYTAFSISVDRFEADEQTVKLQITVENSGSLPGKDVVQLYFGGDFPSFYMPEKQLAAFAKTKELAPGEREQLLFTINKSDLAAYDDTGKSGFRDAFVLPRGRYRFFIGENAGDTQIAGEFEQKETICVRQCRSVLPPEKNRGLTRLYPIYDGEKAYKAYAPTPCEDSAVRIDALKNRILANLPQKHDASSAGALTLDDVRKDPALLDDFIAEMTADELEAISRGDYQMNSPLGPKGNAGVFGGVTQSLRDKGVPPVTTTDGPSGIRLAATSALLPCGTALACTWNTSLVQSLYEALGTELRDRRSDVLLAPGMNIHRNPLCGRNFEYFSEDPFLSGKMAAAVISGLKAANVNGCPKHFACNNQEINRTNNDSVLSERALREIYLKGFEICVKEAQPNVLMTSYNKINGVWGHYQYPLVTEILRDEWGYDGLVITDWWMRPSASPEFPQLKNQAYRVRAGVDVLMPGGERTGKRKPDGTLLQTLDSDGGITRGELQNTAKHVIQFILKLKYNNDTSKEIDQNESHEL